MQHSAHGSYIIEQQSNILLVDVQEPFNDVTAENYHQDIKQLIEKMTGEPWGSLITFRGSSVFTPDAEQQLRETTQYRQEKGMIAIAVVILNSAYADMQQMQLQRIYHDCQIEFHVFSDSEIAADWLNDFIEQANSLKNKQRKA
ncbi:MULTISPECIES: hypothetical protein [Colwellia]|jgi:hypothetical protein|uniref:STAS/SEC14 domain-containing protein n=1 Tax=Colwellia psychrerythraea (strain 34H / ATCC BAA-681) TaxID=167879 RepID=Q47W68_COLP3|nr:MULTISPECIES: hypothetical protein [Colwellia]AAZ28569.1 hypothetical protein CPS_4304 [Colwellia psychrerythraea 34H]PKH85440.1 hypothetical protein CXF79_19445 [Colwellia sp. Bg11-28]